MPLDAVFLTAVVDEISPYCVDSRIDKVQQPEKDKIILSVRGKSGNRKLLLCARAGSARLHITKEPFENPASPPMFCMLLRKHLTGARITGLSQPPMERIVQIDVIGHDELGESSEKHIYIELMGRYSNIILTDADSIIIDSLRRVDEEMSRSRRILPGLRYKLPPLQGELSPLETDIYEIASAFEQAPGESKISKWLQDSFTGLSPLICRELTERCAGSIDARRLSLEEKGRDEFLSDLNAFLDKIKKRDFIPFMLMEGSVPFDYSYTEIRQYGDLMTGKTYPTFSELLENYYALRDREDRLKQRAGTLIKSLTTIRNRTARKVEHQREDLRATENRDRKRELGDIITANLHQMKKGDTVFRAHDFYSSEGEYVDIPLNPLKTPQQNAAAYYKEYNKLKNAEKYLREQIKKGESDRDYLDSVLESISRADMVSDISEIRRELSQTGYLKDSKKKQKEAPSRPLFFKSSDGFEIIAGKNNLQNENLTFKTAMRGDIWLHAQKIHGSHAVIRCAGEKVPEKTIEEAAIITACHSQCGEGQKVPVDYTEIRYVKRQPGGKPGMVFYTDYKTVIVIPNRSISERLAISDK